MNSRIPGALCQELGHWAVDIKDGTMARTSGLVPGALGGETSPMGRLLQGVATAAAATAVAHVKARHPALEALSRVASQAMGAVGGGSELDRLTDELLKVTVGSTKNIGTDQRKNVSTVVGFFLAHNVKNKDVKEWANLCSGIDFHAAEAITVETLPKGELVAEYVETGRPADRQIGQWLVKVRGAVSNENVGLSGEGRERKVYELTQAKQVLKSKAAGAADHWTGGANKPHHGMTFEKGSRVRKEALQVAGGGDQYFLPEAWRYLKEVQPKSGSEP